MGCIRLKGPWGAILGREDGHCTVYAAGAQEFWYAFIIWDY